MYVFAFEHLRYFHNQIYQNLKYEKTIYHSNYLVCISIHAGIESSGSLRFGKDRKFITSTVEMFKPDKWGSTFFFIDMNYDADNGKTISLAYWEIARAVKIGKSPFAAHVEGYAYSRTFFVYFYTIT